MTSNGWRFRGGRDAEKDHVYRYPYYGSLREQDQADEEEAQMQRMVVRNLRKLTKAIYPNYYRLSKNKTHCELCGNDNVPFQLLEVDHFDRNHLNDSRDNLWVLCKACHRQKTFAENTGKSLGMSGLVDLIRNSPEVKAKWRAKSEEWLAEREGRIIKKPSTTPPEQLSLF